MSKDEQIEALKEEMEEHKLDASIFRKDLQHCHLLLKDRDITIKELEARLEASEKMVDLLARLHNDLLDE